MKIDLRKDRGILSPVSFFSLGTGEVEMSEDELIAETLRRRHAPVSSETEGDTGETTTEVIQKKKDKDHTGWLFLLLIIVLSGSGYYLNKLELLTPAVDIVKNYWMGTLGYDPIAKGGTLFDDLDTFIVEETVLSDDVFNQLMPVTQDIAALADSIAALPVDSLRMPESDFDMTEDNHVEYTAIVETPIQLSDHDIVIINNRSLLLLITEIIEIFPEDNPNAHLFLKRDALRMDAPAAGPWIEEVKSTLERFVLGSFNALDKNGSVQLSSKFEIIMNAEQGFQAQVLDGIRLLDILANPFSDYLNEIVIDISRDVNDNPAILKFTGSKQEIQYILSSWAETRSNFLIRSIDLKFQKDDILLTFDVLFFNYRP